MAQHRTCKSIQRELYTATKARLVTFPLIFRTLSHSSTNGKVRYSREVVYPLKVALVATPASAQERALIVSSHSCARFRKPAKFQDRKFQFSLCRALLLRLIRAWNAISSGEARSPRHAQLLVACCCSRRDVSRVRVRVSEHRPTCSAWGTFVLNILAVFRWFLSQKSSTSVPLNLPKATFTQALYQSFLQDGKYPF